MLPPRLGEGRREESEKNSNQKVDQGAAMERIPLRCQLAEQTRLQAWPWCVPIAHVRTQQEATPRYEERSRVLEATRGVAGNIRSTFQVERKTGPVEFAPWCRASVYKRSKTPAKVVSSVER